MSDTSSIAQTELTKGEQERVKRLRRRDHPFAGVWGGKANAKRAQAHAVRCSWLGLEDK